MDRAEAVVVQKEITDALGEIARRHNLVLTTGRFTYSATEVGLRAEFRVANPDTGEPADFRQSAVLLGLPADCYGRGVEVVGKRYTITGIALRRHRYPVTVEHRGQSFKLSASVVLAALRSAQESDDRVVGVLP